MILGRINYGRWFLRLLTWDGLVPIAVLAIPVIAKHFFPNRPQVVEAMGVFVPITAFLARFYVARRHILANACPRWMRGLQLIALGVGILILLLLDAILILTQEQPNGVLFATPADAIITIVMILVYAVCMAFAMYPGRTCDEESSNWAEPAQFAQT